MIQKIITEIGKSQRLRIVNALKRSQGLSVRELCGRLSMSYMGIKQHCVDLEHDGYVDTWRNPRPVGRPELLYRLTRKAHELFPTSSNESTIELLESACRLYGPSSAEKLLFMVFKSKGDKYQARLKGDTLAQRAKWLARLRDHEGHMSEFSAEGTLRIVEYHSPILDLLSAYPLVGRLESEMFQRVLKTAVRREEKTVSGLYSCTFHLDAA